MNDEFEKQLQRQPMRGLPREWRSEILAAAAVRPSQSSKISWLTEWLWPHPRAWAGLTAAWAVIILFHFTAPDDPRVARSSASTTFQSMAEMQQQTVRMAQLLGSSDSGDPPSATPATPKPRSERPRQQLIG